MAAVKRRLQLDLCASMTFDIAMVEREKCVLDLQSTAGEREIVEERAAFVTRFPHLSSTLGSATSISPLAPAFSVVA